METASDNVFWVDDMHRSLGMQQLQKLNADLGNVALDERLKERVMVLILVRRIEVGLALDMIYLARSPLQASQYRIVRVPMEIRHVNATLISPTVIIRRVRSDVGNTRLRQGGEHCHYEAITQKRLERN
jgi:hypothetical protein